MRFYGRTSAHTRVLHFRTWASSLVQYLRTGVGKVNAAQLKAHWMALPGHTAGLPASATDGADVGSNQGDFAATFSPFRSAAAEWAIKPGMWHVDEISALYSANTIHQVWVRPSGYAAPLAASADVVAGNVAATLADATLTKKFPDVGGAAVTAPVGIALPLAFNLFGVNYGTGGSYAAAGAYVGDNGFVTFGAGSSVAAGFSAATPGVGLLLGAADRSLLYAGITALNTTASGLKHATLALRWYAAASGAVGGDEIALEVTFAASAGAQYIEIRAGNIAIGTTPSGVWGLSDGAFFAAADGLSAGLSAGQSVVYQSGLDGRYWSLFANQSLLDVRPPAAAPAGAHANCPCVHSAALAPPKHLGQPASSVSPPCDRPLGRCSPSFHSALLCSQPPACRSRARTRASVRRAIIGWTSVARRCRPPATRRSPTAAAGCWR